VDLDVVFLGTSASAPTARRAPAAALIRHGGDRILIDCGEGTQRQLLRSTVGLVDLERIFITHLHADHYLGLPGLLKTFTLRMRELPLTIYGPPGLRELVDSLHRVFGRLSYPVELVELRAGEAVVADGYRLLAFPVSHGVAALGYALVEPERPGRFDEGRAAELGVPFGPERGRLQRGESVRLADGRTVNPDELLGSPRPGRTVVYTGDTTPAEVVEHLFPRADLLVHEATFAEEESGRAAETRHSTASGAARVALAAQVSLLALTHISPRYFGPELLREAREIFAATVAPRDFDLIEVPFPERGEPVLVKRGARPVREAAEAPTP
jgi:ribonuclease Z